MARRKKGGGKYADRLAGMNDSWAERNDEPLKPIGIQLMILEHIELRESQSSGKLMIARKHVCLEGEFEGESVSDYMSLETARGPYFVNRFFQVVGVGDIEEISEIEDAISELNETNPIYTAEIRYNDDFANVRVIELQDGSDIEESEEPEEPEEPCLDIIGDSVTFEDEDGEIVEGVVTGQKGTSIVVTDSAGDPWEMAVEDVTLASESIEEGEGAEPVEFDVAPYVDLAEAAGVPDDMSGCVAEEDVKAIFEQYDDWAADELSAAEVKLVKGLGVKVAKKSK